MSERARKLHESALVFDGHIHAVDREFYHGGDMGQRKSDGQFDLGGCDRAILRTKDDADCGTSFWVRSSSPSGTQRPSGAG